MADTWNDSNAAALSDYLARNPRFLNELKRRMPTIETKGTIDQAAMSGARYAGAKDMLDAIEDMQGSQGDVRTTPFINEARD